METPSSRVYLVPTPIGNLDDMTFRAIEVLKSVDFILAEDTRRSGKLLKHFEIENSLVSFHAHSEHKKLGSVIDRLRGGESCALISDAGTPGISDPGFLLVRESIKNNIPVECLPGATAFVPALVKSGIPCDRFVFEGFIPQKKGRNTAIQRIIDEERTVVFYESPHKLLKTLEQLSELSYDDDRQISVSRELTKLHEETVTGSVQEVLEEFNSRPSIKGEFVIVIEGRK